MRFQQVHFLTGSLEIGLQHRNGGLRRLMLVEQLLVLFILFSLEIRS